MPLPMQSLNTLSFQNTFVANFPGDESGSVLPRQTPGMLYSLTQPTPVKQVKLIGWSDALATDLHIGKPAQTGEETNILGGNKVLSNMRPYAACYAGHQFGNWAGQLGDGRAITLGENITPGKSIVEFQLKGAGPTAYSRRADGRAVLRSSVREYLMSEAMHHLGVPTTRALSLVSTGDDVMRDMFYNGNPAHEPGAIVLRVAPSFLRFGNFEILAARGETDNLKKLADWTIDKFFTHLTGENKLLDWYKEVVDRTAKLMVEWLRVGFVHGVMNTDNMSILGLTIDYGPYAFVDNYDPNFTPNTTDLPGRRYAFSKQPAIGKWNLGCLGGAIAPLFASSEPLIEVLDGYDNIYWNYYNQMMAAKLGLDVINKKDVDLLNKLEEMLSLLQPDMTIFYQLLIDLPGTFTPEALSVHFEHAFYTSITQPQSDILYDWMQRYANRLTENKISKETSQQQMLQANPRIILRNYMLHEAIEALENGDDCPFNKLQQAMQYPYSRKFDEFFTRRPDWASAKAGCSMLSCSS